MDYFCKRLYRQCSSCAEAVRVLLKTGTKKQGVFSDFKLILYTRAFLFHQYETAFCLLVFKLILKQVNLLWVLFVWYKPDAYHGKFLSQLSAHSGE